MALLRPTPHDPGSPSTNESPTDNTEPLVLVENPEKQRLPQLPAPRREKYLTAAKIILVLIFAISYLIFCFVVRYLHFPIGRSVGVKYLWISTVSVITTVAILVSYVVLWPIKDVVDVIRAEEFFRLMDTHPNGVPLNSVNEVSATTTGAFEIIKATIRRHCSRLLTSTLVISLAITATSTIAPAALSAESIWVDVYNSTFLIGAFPKRSFLRDRGNGSWSYNPDLLAVASTMAWVENFLNHTNGYYGVASSEGEYLVPFPPGYTSTMKAHWTTDVIVINPSCSWETVTATASDNSSWNVTLPKSNLSFSMGLLSSDRNITRVSTYMLRNHSTPEFTAPVDGSVLFVIDQLSFPRSHRPVPIHTRTVDLSAIPTLKFPAGNVLAFLQCSPHISIQTRQVLATGNGNLTLGKHQPSQGNIDLYQANYLLSYVLLELPTNSGPTTDSFQMGTDLMMRFILGVDVGPNSNSYLFRYIPPAPLANITAVYKQVLHSSMKTFLSGAIATENVPGGYSEERFVFTSSLGHVITSVVLFAFLTIALIAAQFRRERAAFTLINVAAALADSDLPQESVKMAPLKAGTGKRKVLKLVLGGDGQHYCVYESID